MLPAQTIVSIRMASVRTWVSPRSCLVAALQAVESVLRNSVRAWSLCSMRHLFRVLTHHFIGRHSGILALATASSTVTISLGSIVYQCRLAGRRDSLQWCWRGDWFPRIPVSKYICLTGSSYFPSSTLHLSAERYLSLLRGKDCQSQGMRRCQLSERRAWQSSPSRLRELLQRRLIAHDGCIRRSLRSLRL